MLLSGYSDKAQLIVLNLALGQGEVVEPGATYYKT